MCWIKTATQNIVANFILINYNMQQLSWQPTKKKETGHFKMIVIKSYTFAIIHV